MNILLAWTAGPREKCVCDVGSVFDRDYAQLPILPFGEIPEFSFWILECYRLLTSFYFLHHCSETSCFSTVPQNTLWFWSKNGHVLSGIFWVSLSSIQTCHVFSLVYKCVCSWHSLNEDDLNCIDPEVVIRVGVNSTSSILIQFTLTVSSI